jgi:hypothetical protein
VIRALNGPARDTVACTDRRIANAELQLDRRREQRLEAAVAHL